MSIDVICASEIDEPLARQIRVLLGRAYTDERHQRVWDGKERALLEAPAAAARAAPPSSAPEMPAEYLDDFPTVSNLRRDPDGRREADHLLIRKEDYLATHLSLWAQHFRLGDAAAGGGYIEDVATDPLHVGEGLASEAMRAAASRARTRGLDLLGLATGIPPFYERLGWRTWRGAHTVHVTGSDLSFVDEPLMLLPLTERGVRLAAGEGAITSWRLWRFGDIPDIAAG